MSDIQALFDSSIPKVTIGSITLTESGGNKGLVYSADAAGNTLNSIGLKNRGLEFYKKVLPDLISSTDKKIRVNIAGTTPSEYGMLVRALLALGAREIEINASCPNVWKSGTQKRIATYDHVLLRAIIANIQKVSKERIFDYKLSPIANPAELKEVAKILAGVQHIRAVVTSNTFPNAYDEKIGLAGLGGASLYQIALGQVFQFRKLLPKKIVVVGVGGISSKEQVQQFEHAGASEVQVGSYYFENGPKVFKDL